MESSELRSWPSFHSPNRSPKLTKKARCSKGGANSRSAIRPTPHYADTVERR